MDDRKGECGGVLSDSEIRRLIEGTKEKPMIENADDLDYCVKSASYNIRVGEECLIRREKKLLGQKELLLVIPPYEVALLSSYEVFHIPDDLVGEYELRMALLYKGLTLQTGLHLDPGYEGKVFSLLFNLSDKDVVLRYKEPFASVQFLTVKGKVKNLHKHHGKPVLSMTDSRVPIDMTLQSGLSALEQRASRMFNMAYAAGAFMVAILGIVVAAIAAVAAAPGQVDWWAYVVGVAVYAVTVGAFAYAIRRAAAAPARRHRLRSLRERIQRLRRGRGRQAGGSEKDE